VRYPHLILKVVWFSFNLVQFNAILSGMWHGRTFHELVFPFFLWRFDSILGLCLLLGGFAIILTVHITPGRTSQEEWSARRREPYLTAHNTHNRHPCPRQMATHNPIRRGAADPRLRPRGHRDRLMSLHFSP